MLPRIMKRSDILFFTILLTAAVCGSVCADMADLDAALNMQKKKPRHRTYSTQATLHDQNLVVPSGPNEEEQALDEAMRKKNAALDQAASLSRQRTPAPRMTVPRTDLQQNSNWLIPETEEENPLSADDQEDSWLVQEMLRQQDIKKDEILLKEEEDLVQKQLRDRQRMQSLKMNRPQQSPLTSSPFFNRKTEQKQSTTGLQTPFADPASSRNREPTSGLSPFSANQPKATSGIIAKPFDLKNIRERAELTPEPKKESPFDLSSKWDSPQKKLSPLESIKKSAPINRKNPFEENTMPTFKHSIWD